MSIFHRLHINVVILRVFSNPFDEYYLVPIVNGHNQPVVVAFDVEDHSARSNNAGIGISFQNIGWAFPAGSEDLMEPCIERRLDRLLMLAAFETMDEFPQRLPCNDPHGQT